MLGTVCFCLKSLGLQLGRLGGQRWLDGWGLESSGAAHSNVWMLCWLSAGISAEAVSSSTYKWTLHEVSLLPQIQGGWTPRCGIPRGPSRSCHLWLCVTSTLVIGPPKFKRREYRPLSGSVSITFKSMWYGISSCNPVEKLRGMMKDQASSYRDWVNPQIPCFVIYFCITASKFSALK